jgi:hypothetical protein
MVEKPAERKEEAHGVSPLLRSVTILPSSIV